MLIDNDFLKKLRQIIKILEREFDFQLKNETVCCGITISQCHILIELAERGESSIKALSEFFGVDKSTLSRTTDALVESGYITRKENKEDRRFFDLSLTVKGIEKAHSINMQSEKYYSEVISKIPKEKQKMLIDSLALLESIIADIRKCCSDE